MPVNIKYIEKAGSMEGLLIIDDPNDANQDQEFRIPKFIFDLVKASIQNGTLDMTVLWNRTLDIVKALP